MKNSGVMLYCISKSDDEVNKIKGLDNSELKIIEHNGLFGIYSEISLNEYNEDKTEDINWIKDKAFEFMKVMTLIQDKVDLIPMKFLTIFNNKERIIEVLNNNYTDFIDTFDKISGSIEVNIKIYCDDNSFKETSIKEEIEEFNESIKDKPKGAAFFLKKKFDSELDSIVNNKTTIIANTILDSLKPYSIEMKTNKLLAKELTGVTERMVANCAILISKTSKNNFLKKIADLKKQYESIGLNIEFSGPWPPYNFCA